MRSIDWATVPTDAELSQARIMDALDHIDCSKLTYDEWLHVGMALKAEGFGCEVWDDWSRTDPDRYEDGSCAEKWDGFNGNGYAGGTIIYLAREQGWDGGTSGYGWTDTVRTQDAPAQLTTTKQSKTAQTFPVLDPDKLPPADVGEYPAMAEGFDCAEQLREYMRYVFLPGELVNIVTETDADGSPCGWGVTMERDELISRAAEVLDGCDEATGAWVRVNPVCDAETLERMQRERDAKGKRRARAYCNEHVTAFRHALIECDPDNAQGMTADELAADKARQLDKIRRLNLPCAAIVDSGGKSIHAIVRMDATDAKQYRERVRWLHGFLGANHMQKLDAANKNPSRMSRLAGAVRGESTQRLIDVAAGPLSWDDWREWVERMAKAEDAEDAIEADEYETDADEGETDADEGETDADTSSTTPDEDTSEDKPKGNTQGALLRFMESDEALRGKFGTNVLDGGRYVLDALPWDESGERRRWTDADTECLYVYAQARTKTKNRRDVQGAFIIVSALNRFNPISDMLDELPAWDGEARADFLLWVLFGCEDTDYTRAVSRAFMRGAVLRGYEPGCKFDSVLTLIGPQGCGKSFGTREMVMEHDELLCESVTDLTDLKLTAEQTGGRWIVELAELEGMTGRRLTAVKQAITMQQITVRLSYAREAIDLPRSCVFIATTNEAEFLADPTGARRFWPVRCAVDAERGGWAHVSDRQRRAFIMQAWAEVVAEYKAARAASADADEFRAAFPTVLDQNAEHMADEARDAASVEDTRIGVIREWLEDVRTREGVTRVCTRMVAERALSIDMARQRGHRLTTELAFILTNRCPQWHFIGKQRIPGYGDSVRAWEWRQDAGQQTVNATTDN